MTLVSCLIQVLVKLHSRGQSWLLILLCSLHILLKLKVLEIVESLGWLRFRAFSFTQMSHNLAFLDLFAFPGKLI